MPFDGLRVLSLESRRAGEIEAMIRREGGIPLVAPSVKERALDEHGDVLHFVERLENGEFDLIICMTGVGLAFLRQVVEAHMPVERMANGLRNVKIISRGPKPIPILRELGVRADIVVPEPNTWKEVVEAVALLPQRRIAVQEYGRPNSQMTEALEQLGATVTPIAIYRWELPADLGPLRDAARQLAARQFDVVLFTSSIQLDHLLEVSRESGIEPDVLRTLRSDVAIASVGPVMTQTLESYGLVADIIPNHPKMGALVKAASEYARAIVEQKRRGLAEA